MAERGAKTVQSSLHLVRQKYQYSLKGRVWAGGGAGNMQYTPNNALTKLFAQLVFIEAIAAHRPGVRGLGDTSADAVPVPSPGGARGGGGAGAAHGGADGPCQDGGAPPPVRRPDPAARARREFTLLFRKVTLSTDSSGALLPGRGGHPLSCAPKEAAPPAKPRARTSQEPAGSGGSEILEIG